MCSAYTLTAGARTIVPHLQFNIRFKTTYGQSLWICGSCPELGGGEPANAVPMQYLNSEFWQLNLTTSISSKTANLGYHYLLRNQDGIIIAEWEKDRLFKLEKDTAVRFIDTWNHAGELENAFFTAPFLNVLNKTPKKRKDKKPSTCTHILRVKAPLLKNTEEVCLIGNDPLLGSWSEKAPLLLSKNGNWWEISLDLSKAVFPLSYKYGIWNHSSDRFIRFEEGENRLLENDHTPTMLNCIQDGFLRIGAINWKGAGVAIPVFSLRSKNSFGVGEFLDIRKLADWADLSGLKLIQLLPINDTTATNNWMDSYPYAAISAFALHPLYINLAEVAGTKHSAKLRTLRKMQEQLNKQPTVDYEAVIRIKTETLRILYKAMGEECFDTAEYKSFFAANKFWLKPYAAFCYCRDLYDSTRFEQWPQYSQFVQDEIDELFTRRNTANELGFYCFVQYHLHCQLTTAVDYVHKKGIILKGDIPIGIYRYGVDAWVEPELYNMNWQAGAPPDDFTAIGQNWGFPTYNWKKMQEDGFSWWKKRFEQMGRYFDAFRIDHILGFFRIWSIPTNAVQGLLGRFVPCQPVHINEFSQRGISFDYKRYCQPFIQDEILFELFGDQQFHVKEQFLIRQEDGSWALSPMYDTQQKVEQYFEGLGKDSYAPRLKEGLMELIANVILFEEPGSQGHQFHFRISMDKTWSFRYLSQHIQAVLRELYNDYFYSRQDQFWYREAMQKLPSLKAATNMLVCGEDLGMVPHCVPDVMKQTGILSLEIQRMPKDPKKEFFHPADAPYMSVVTPSTHDMSTIRGWWEENRQRTQLFYNQEMKQWGDAPYYCEAWVNRSIVMQHLHSPAMWSIFQLQDLLGMSDTVKRSDPREERINDPANPRHYWQYRMHLDLEELLIQKDFNQSLRAAILESGR